MNIGRSKKDNNIKLGSKPEVESVAKNNNEMINRQKDMTRNRTILRST